MGKCTSRALIVCRLAQDFIHTIGKLSITTTTQEATAAVSDIDAHTGPERNTQPRSDRRRRRHRRRGEECNIAFSAFSVPVVFSPLFGLSVLCRPPWLPRSLLSRCTRFYALSLTPPKGRQEGRKEGRREGRSGKGITKAANLNAFYIALFMQVRSFVRRPRPPSLVSTSKKGAHDDANKRARAAQSAACHSVTTRVEETSCSFGETLVYSSFRARLQYKYKWHWRESRHHKFH